jgi:hypothetical protein
MQHISNVVICVSHHQRAYLAALQRDTVLDTAALVAMGMPLSVVLVAPLWVVNATDLPIDAAIVPIPPQATSQVMTKKWLCL